MSDATERATRGVRGDLELSLDDVKLTVGELKSELEFAITEALLRKTTEKHPDDVWLKQQLALCTYKDEEIHPATRFDRALTILEGVGLRDPSNRDAETLGLGGAIYKRKWAYGGQIEDLFQALAFYRAAYERNPEQDRGYGGVNAAFVLDLLASRARVAARRSGTESTEVDRLQAQARELRVDMVKTLAPLADASPELKERYWFVATLAEIHFGLGDFEEARNWLVRIPELGAREWELETTFRQLLALASFQGIEPPPEDSPPAAWPPAWRALAGMLGETATARALYCYHGKTGLALSGGGFRASFYHLGVLARLSEIDALRGVEIMSTVSGGSIIGAHYYLEVQRLLESKHDEEITREDYIEIVKRLQRAFLDGVQQNIRIRVLSNLMDNARMVIDKSYSRSLRLGQLYEECLYSRVADGHPSNQARRISELLVTPSGTPGGAPFKPHFSNWRRRAKVPVLLLNATSLNSGHNWQFTASWMGEPPGVQGGEINKTRRYRRLYYRQAPEHLRNYRLGYAVAASSCVPALFEPLVIDGLYPDQTVRLVDGGVYDNQGVEGLLDQGATRILCSDASGQLGTESDPPDSILAVPMRASSITMDRVREAEYQNLNSRVESRALQGLFFVHLKQDLPVPPVSWINDPEPDTDGAARKTVTDYGVAVDLQEKIAAIRTDLDSFTDVEAYSLMLSGYLVTAHQFTELQKEHLAKGETGKSWGGYRIDAPRETDWPFRALDPIIGQGPESADPARASLKRQLEVAASRFFKVWRLDPGLRRAFYIGAAVFAVLILLLILMSWSETLSVSVRVSSIIVLLLLFIAGATFPLIKWLVPEKAERGYAAKAALAVLGWIGTNIHLRFFDKRFLAQGKLERLLALRNEPAP